MLPFLGLNFFPNYASLRFLGNTHKFNVNVNGQEITFEPDEEKHYRAKIEDENLNNFKPVDINLLKSIAESLESFGR